MTNINRKLRRAHDDRDPRARHGASVASYGTLHPARDFGISPSGRHFAAHQAPRSSVEFQRGDRHWTDV